MSKIVSKTYTPDPEVVPNAGYNPITGKILAGSFYGPVESQLGIVNPTTGNFESFFPVNGANAYTNRISNQSDGKYVVGFMNTFSPSPAASAIGRYSTTGVIDTTFNSNVNATGLFDVSFYTIDTMIIQSDDKIVTAFNSNFINTIKRLNSDGTADSAFNANTSTFNGQASGIVVQSDGKIIVVGGFNTYNGNTRLGIFRLNSDGTEDTSFYTSFSAAFPSLLADINIITLYPDDTILLSYSGGLFKFSQTYVADSTFNSNSSSAFSTVDSIRSMIIDSSNRVVIGGGFSFTSGSTLNVGRLLSNGSLDTTFNSNVGVGPGDQVEPLITDGSSYWLGNPAGYTSFSGSTCGFAKITSTGAPDSTFNDAFGVQTFKAPAGVTVVTINFGYSFERSIEVPVTPNTSYVMTVNNFGDFDYNNPNTLGSIFQWTEGAKIVIRWVE